MRVSARAAGGGEDAVHHAGVTCPPLGLGAQMRAAPVLPLYAVAHGATATAVGLIVGAHMAAAAVGSG